MPMRSTRPLRARGTARVLTCAVGSVTLMWLLSYMALLIGGSIIGDMLFGLAVLALLGGGLVAGRLDEAMDAAGGHVLRGVAVGAVAAVLNLLVIASLLQSDISSAGAWVAGIFLGCVIVGGIGGAVGGQLSPWRTDGNWLTMLCWAVTGLTFFMIVTGGIVTGFEAGLAVPDWPGSYGHNMLLYPLTEMVSDPTHGIFYEHAHRLTGMFVGVTAIVLCGMLWVSDGRPTLGVLGTVVLLLVITQGVLGGLRVTGVEGAGAPEVPPEPSLTMAIVHGVLAQIVLGLMAVTAAMSSTRWRQGKVDRGDATRSADTILSVALLVALVIQLAIGAVYRHLAGEEGPRVPAAMHTLMMHILVAVIVAIIGVIVGLRCAGIDGRDDAIQRTGIAFLVVVGLQIVLGIAAMVVVLARPETGTTADVPPLEVIITSAHQANGAIMLVCVMLIVAWLGRADDAPDVATDA